MPIDYTGIREQVGIDIRDVGMSMTLSRTVNRGGRPHNPVQGVEETTVVGILTRFTDAERDLVREGERKVLMSAEGLSFPPAPGHSLVIGGKPHAVVAADPLSPAGIDVLYKLRVRA